MEILAALGGVAIGALLTYFLDRRQQDRALRFRWSERASEALADVDVLLTEMQPNRIMFNFDPDTTADDVREIERKTDQARRAIAVLAAGHPDPELRELARDLQMELFNCVVQLEWLVSEMIDGEDAKDSLKDATDGHTAATKLLEQVTLQLHA